MPIGRGGAPFAMPIGLPMLVGPVFRGIVIGGLAIGGADLGGIGIGDADLGGTGMGRGRGLDIGAMLFFPEESSEDREPPKLFLEDMDFGPESPRREARSSWA